MDSLDSISDSRDPRSSRKVRKIAREGYFPSYCIDSLDIYEQYPNSSRYPFDHLDSNSHLHENSFVYSQLQGE